MWCKQFFTMWFHWRTHTKNVLQHALIIKSCMTWIWLLLADEVIKHPSIHPSTIANRYLLVVAKSGQMSCSASQYVSLDLSQVRWPRLNSRPLSQHRASDLYWPGLSWIWVHWNTDHGKKLNDCYTYMHCRSWRMGVDVAEFSFYH